jgi:branched-chain amino acid transport system substrate-binding protein
LDAARRSHSREWAKKYGLAISYDRGFPPNTLDFAPIVRAIQAANPDIVYISCFPPNIVGIVRGILIVCPHLRGQ